MTAKHFIIVARCVANISNDITRMTLANDLADEFEKINERFSREKFLAACNVQQSAFPMVGKEGS